MKRWGIEMEIVAYIVSGPTGNYDARIPVRTDKQEAHNHALRMIEGEEGYAIGIELENGEVTFEW